MKHDFGNKHSMETAMKIFGGGLIWFALAVLLVIVLIITTIRFGKVSGEQVGIILDKMNGKMEVIDQPGVTMYNGITKDFYVLDKTIQTLPMTGNKGLKVKTIDGSDVYVDLKIQYKIIPADAVAILKTSGPDNAFKQKWAWDYSRSICRNALGELTTEQFYDSSKRRLKIQSAKKTINDKLTKNFGIEIKDVIMTKKPRFYREYEALIKKKKLADQAVLEEKSKALAATQLQQTRIVEETNAKNVAIEQFSGMMEQKVIQANAEAEQGKKAAEAYYTKVTIGAEADLYKNKKVAESILARKQAQAKGIEAMKKALEGEGGRNMVKMEYAKKLKDVKFNGVPYVVDGKVEKFEHQSAAGAGAKTKIIKRR
jgi:hypothetical protein